MLTVDDMVSKITEKMLTYFMDGPMDRNCHSPPRIESLLNEKLGHSMEIEISSNA